MRPLETPVAETATLAKCDLPVGTTLGAIGETFYRGWAITREDSMKRKAIPLGLAQGAITTQSVNAGEYLTHDNCRVDEDLKIVQLRRLQDKLLDNIAPKCRPRWTQQLSKNFIAGLVPRTRLVSAARRRAPRRYTQMLKAIAVAHAERIKALV